MSHAHQIVPRRVLSPADWVAGGHEEERGHHGVEAAALESDLLGVAAAIPRGAAAGGSYALLLHSAIFVVMVHDADSPSRAIASENPAVPSTIPSRT